MRARSTNVLSALACRVQFHSDKPVKWRPFLPPETFPPGTVRCSNRRMICEFGMGRYLRFDPGQLTTFVVHFGTEHCR